MHTHATLRRLDSSFPLLERHLDPLLVSEESRPRIREVAATLPVFAVEFFGFEARLGAENAPADCALNLTADGARMLAGRHDVALPDEMRDGAWPRVETFYREWGDTHVRPYADATCTWLEFDTTSGGAPQPNLLFGYWPQNTDVRRPLPWLFDKAIPMLLGIESMSPAFRANLQRCFDAQPRPSGDFQIGVMLARGIQAARLCQFDLPREAVPQYLADVGWKGPVSAVCDALDALAPHADFVGLHLDVGEMVFPHIGIEPNFTAGCWTRQPQHEARWHGQFDALEAMKLLVPAKRDALLAWTGHQVCSFGEENVLLLRGLSHVKLVIRHDGKALAKGYFGIAHRAVGATA
jgi:hypothetical protein